MIKGVPRKIVIKAALNGYKMEVGCQTLVYETMRQLLAELETYLLSPNACEEMWTRQTLYPDLVPAEQGCATVSDDDALLLREAPPLMVNNI